MRRRIAFLLLMLAFVSPVFASVGLISFTAVGTQTRITLRWETGAEPDNTGFNIYRTEVDVGSFAELSPSQYVQVNQFPIAAQGDVSSGAVYSYDDDDVQANITYFYWLEDIDRFGTTTHHGPASAELSGGGQIGPPTDTPTPTPSNTPSATPTKSPTATATATGVPPTDVPTNEPTATATASLEPTATDEPTQPPVTAVATTAVATVVATQPTLELSSTPIPPTVTSEPTQPSVAVTISPTVPPVVEPTAVPATTEPTSLPEPTIETKDETGGGVIDPTSNEVAENATSVPQPTTVVATEEPTSVEVAEVNPIQAEPVATIALTNPTQTSRPLPLLAIITGVIGLGFLGISVTAALIWWRRSL